MFCYIEQFNFMFMKLCKKYHAQRNAKLFRANLEVAEFSVMADKCIPGFDFGFGFRVWFRFLYSVLGHLCCKAAEVAKWHHLSSTHNTYSRPTTTEKKRPKSFFPPHASHSDFLFNHLHTPLKNVQRARRQMWQP